MTESEWLTSENPGAMLDFLVHRSRPDMPQHATPGDRKLRLFAVACCRAVSSNFDDAASSCFDDFGLAGLAVAELYADGEAAFDAMRDAGERSDRFVNRGLVKQVTTLEADAAAWNMVHRLRTDRLLPRVDVASILRDIIGNPYRSVALPRAPAAKKLWQCRYCRLAGRYCRLCHGSTKVEAACGECLDKKMIYTGMDGIKWIECVKCPVGHCPWLTPDVQSVALAAYEDRAGDGAIQPCHLLPLSDALEEAGCANPELLAHLRSPGPHYRGCWALDLILGKE